MQNKHFFFFLDVPTFGEGSQAGLTEEKKYSTSSPQQKAAQQEKVMGQKKYVEWMVMVGGGK